VKTALFLSRKLSSALEKIPAAELIVRTWLPSVKMKKDGAVIRRPVTTAEIKKGLPSFQNDRSSVVSVEPYGHASVSLFIDLKRVCFRKEFIELLQASLGIDMHAMSTLEAYMSLYPAYDPVKETYISGRQRTLTESEKYGQFHDYLQKTQEVLPDKFNLNQTHQDQKHRSPKEHMQ
jgi:hypothetical protein